MSSPVTFTLASPLQHSKAQPRVMFFPHLKTDRHGILNAMANEQAIPVKAEISGGATSVTLVLWGTIGCQAWLEAHNLARISPERQHHPLPSARAVLAGRRGEAPRSVRDCRAVRCDRSALAS